MPKKKSRKSRTSQGIVGSPKKARTSVGIERVLNQLAAWEKGKNVRVTVPNRNERETNRRLHKVSGRDAWGAPPYERKRQQMNRGENNAV